MVLSGLLLGSAALLAFDSGCRQKQETSAAGEFAELEAKQTRCPVDGKPVDREISVEYASRHVFFCSSPCRQKFSRDNRAYLEKLPQFGGTE